MFGRALEALVRELEKRRFAATDKPRRRQQRRSSRNKRHIPAGVKRTVWKRDQGRCTFVSEAGNRCPARTRLELDHVDPVARGGRATAEQMRLHCRAHNQYAAERTFGTTFMSRKREAAQCVAEERRKAKALVAEEARAQATAAAERAKELDVVPWLRKLGFRAEQARCAAQLCQNIPDAPLEVRVRRALSYFAKPATGGRGVGPVTASVS